MKILKLFIGIVIIITTSCNKNRVFEKHLKNFTEYKWEASNICEYNPTIEDIDAKYKVFFAFRHIYGFQNQSININIEITAPSGKITSKDYCIPIIKSKSQYFGNCAGDYCDLETLLEDNFKFDEVGTYLYKIKHLEPKNPIVLVMEVGLIIELI